MKKILVFAALILSVLIILPIVGNSVVKKQIDQRIEQLKTAGINVKEVKKEKTFFTTHIVYDFEVEDADKFNNFLNQYSNTQIQPYVESVLDGVVVESSVTYSNLLFDDKISIDIYPIKFPKEFMEKAKKSNKVIYDKLVELLKTKGILYHFDYFVSSKSFNGSLKDIDISLDSKNGYSSVVMKIKGVGMKGSGNIVAPDIMETSMKEFELSESRKGNKTFEASFKDVYMSYKYKTKLAYDFDMSVKNIHLTDISYISKTFIDFDNVSLHTVSQTKTNTYEYQTSIKFDKLAYKNDYKYTQLKDFQLDNFEYTLSVKDLDLEAVNKFVDSFEKNSRYSYGYNGYTKDLQELLQKGFTLVIDKVGAKNVTVNSQALEKFNMDANIKIKPNINLNNKKDLWKYISFDINLELSKKLYNFIVQKNKNMAEMLESYKKQKDDSVIFKIETKDQKLLVNDIQVQ